MPGYSGTPLAKKLGIKPGFRVKLKNAPAEYLDWVELPENVHCSTTLRSQIDLWHLFTTSRKELQKVFQAAFKQIKRDGMIWVSWPKKSSGVSSEVTEDTVREVALPMGLVDVKVCGERRLVRIEIGNSKRVALGDSPRMFTDKQSDLQ